MCVSISVNHNNIPDNNIICIPFSVYHRNNNPDNYLISLSYHVPHNINPDIYSNWIFLQLLYFSLSKVILLIVYRKNLDYGDGSFNKINEFTFIIKTCTNYMVSMDTEQSIYPPTLKHGNDAIACFKIH